MLRTLWLLGAHLQCIKEGRAGDARHIMFAGADATVVAYVLGRECSSLCKGWGVVIVRRATQAVVCV